MNLKPIKKIVATFLSGLTTTGVIAFVHNVADVAISQSVAALIVAGAAALAGYLVPDKRVSP